MAFNISLHFAVNVCGVNPTGSTGAERLPILVVPTAWRKDQMAHTSSKKPSLSKATRQFGAICAVENWTSSVSMFVGVTMWTGMVPMAAAWLNAAMVGTTMV
eukprot:162174-Ditylum_brightwellii.AAC.1